MTIDRKIEPPPQAYTRRFAVPQEAIDLLGHVGNVTWLEWVVDMAARHSDSIRLDLAAYHKMGMVWMVRKHEIEYLVQARQGDEIEAFTWVETRRGATSIRRCQFRNTDHKLLVHAATTWVLFDTETQRPKRIPKALLQQYGFEE